MEDNAVRASNASGRHNTPAHFMTKLRTVLTALLLWVAAITATAADFTDGSDLDAAPLSAGWNASSWIDGCDIFLSAQLNGASAWTVRLGPSGVISELKNNTGVALLSPAWGNERTDRVIQWTLWDLGMFASTGSWPVSPLFNVTQAGTFDDNSNPRPPNSISPILKAVLSSNPTRVDIYSRPQDQWYAQNQAVFTGKFASLTRYEIVGPGILTIRRIVLLGEATKYATPEAYHEVYFEAWTPMKRNPFTAIAFSASPSGVPAWWYRNGYNIPHYQNFPVSTTGGYAIAYTESGYATKTAAAICFGTAPANSWSGGVPTPTGSHTLNSMEWNTGTGLLPSLHLFTPPVQTLLDVRYGIVVGPGLNSDFMTRIGYVNSKLPAPRVLAPGITIDGELATIRTTLQNLLTGSDANLLRSSSLGPTLCRPCAE